MSVYSTVYNKNVIDSYFRWELLKSGNGNESLKSHLDEFKMFYLQCHVMRKYLTNSVLNGDVTNI